MVHVILFLVFLVLRLLYIYKFIKVVLKFFSFFFVIIDIHFCIARGAKLNFTSVQNFFGLYRLVESWLVSIC